MGKPHGLKGFFFLAKPVALDPTTILELCVGQALSSAHVTRLAQASYSPKGHLMLKLTTAEDRTAVEKIQGMSLWATLSLPELLGPIGKPVIDVDGKIVGQAIDRQNYGASDIISIKSAKEKCVDLPLVANFFDLNSLEKESIQMLVSSEVFEDFWY